MTIRYLPPYIFDAVNRQRLFLLLDENFHRQNFLITGQAAQGKSTLVASYLHKSNKKALWFHLSEDDGNHINLFDRLAAGIQAFFGKNLEHYNGSIPNSTLGTEKGVLRYIEGLSVLLQALLSPLIIVLDDVQSVMETSTGFQLINSILNHRFENLKFFLLSRTIPSFTLPRLKMETSIFVLNNEHLAFTLDETRLFFFGRLPVDGIDIERVHRITDGWAGGLTLVSESFRQFNKVKNLPDRLSSEVFNFFSQEIYKILPHPIREFLMNTSVLDTIDLETVTHIFDSTDALDILTELEKRNLFIQRIESHSQWPEFKYHDLFREFLRLEFLETKGQESLKTLQQKAGQFFWERKDHEQAMNYFARAGAVSDIVRIIKIKGTDYIINGKLPRLEKWINGLPDEVIQADPWLIFFGTLTRRIKGGKKNIRDFQKAFDLFDQAKDIRGILLSIGYLIEAAVFIRQPSGMILEWIDRGEKQLQQKGQENRYPWARALLWQQIGLGYIAGDGNIPKGVSACRNAILLGRQISNPDLVLHASITMTFGYVQAGDFVNARQMLLKIKEITRKGPYPEYRALKNLVDIDFALKNGRFDDAKKLLTRSEADIEKFGLIFLYPGFIEAKALYLVYTRLFDDARQMADHLNDFSILEGNDFYKGISHRINALVFLKEGKLTQADLEIKEALKSLDQARKGDIHHFLALQLSGTIFFRKKRFIEAKKTLIPALEYFEGISSDLCCTETCFLLGLISWELNETRAAVNYLNQGLQKAVKEGYVFFPLIGEKALIQAFLLLAAHHRIDSFGSYAESFVLRAEPELVFEQMDRILSSAEQREKSLYIENLRPVYKKRLPGIRIETLGRFNIFIGNTLLDSRSFEGARPILLLKAIVLHGSRDIPKEILMDDLWPKATATGGEKNFKINLHRLRKAIEPNARKEFGFSYIIQKAGLVSLDQELVTLDVDEFLIFGSQAVENERNNRFELALECYTNAIGLYKGDYFSEEPYVEWISRKRNLLKAKYMEFLQKKALLHEELDQIENALETWQLALAAEPFFEAAYQNLMILYADFGQRNKAMEIFQEYRFILKTELGTEPDEETVHLYNKIKSR